MTRWKKLFAVLLLLVGCLPLLRSDCHAQLALGGSEQAQTIDVELPSTSTGSEAGTIVVRIQPPQSENSRYPEGAPVIVWLPGGTDTRGLDHGLPPEADDLVIVTFGFPGDPIGATPQESSGVYDYRGPKCILALRDVILYAAGEKTDAQGRTIDDVMSLDVLHHNVGLMGVSNGGNIIVAVAAYHGQDLEGALQYIVQWETPVSSQIATRDFGRVWLKPTPRQGDFVNPRYGGYDSPTLPSDYNDLAYDPGEPNYPVFHDGNGDGVYTTVTAAQGGFETPDLNGDGELGPDEDFPLDAYPGQTKNYYSRPVAQALAERDVLPEPWPEDIGTPTETTAYWDLRESVRLYEQAIDNLPGLEAMVIGSSRDHVQSLPDKPHLRQAWEGWHDQGAWVRLNPDPAYILKVDPGLEEYEQNLPDNAPNTAPSDWSRSRTYAEPEIVPDEVYQLAAVWEMADRVQTRQTAEQGTDPTPRSGVSCWGTLGLFGLVLFVGFKKARGL